MKQKECPSCGWEVDADSKECQYCGYEFPRNKGSFILIAIVLLIALTVLFFKLY